MGQTKRDNGLISAEEVVNAYLNDFESNIGKYFVYITNRRRLSVLLRDTPEGIQDFLNENKTYQVASEISQVREPFVLDFPETPEGIKDIQESFKRFQEHIVM